MELTTAASLTTTGLTRRFGNFTAVDDVNMTVGEGEIRAVIGPNGAGKTTLFNLLTGHLRPTAGEVRLGNQVISGRRAHEVAQHGITRAFQTTNIFPSMTVHENVVTALLGVSHASLRFWTPASDHLEKAADEVLDLVGIYDQRSRQAGILAHGDQRALELAIALAPSPKILLLDEPTAGMSPYETQRSVELLRKIWRELKLTIILSEHDMEVVFGLAQQVTVLVSGRVLADGEPSAVRSNREVISAYLGGVEE
ncbi:ABC transporter ATP-binding protein [Sulfobacillus harzensis]|uniref:ABC transporter ATP-binding protein n=1 Tax=Sulfobacillus harzensis TaxID=2729629 RepID=A0A7Y0Q3S1_9FIRM|nr:ABC transporter ATP-binding protein [Sulfobacillus harzensis]NMP23837.1 ABC transporter ATP-binding protein [Sulfobacillus harzensis]